MEIDFQGAVKLAGRAGRSGRRPKPTALHKLHGTTNVTRHRSRANEAVAEGEAAPAPDFFSADQKIDYDYALTHMPKGVMHTIDSDMLWQWVIARDYVRRITREANKGAILIKVGDAEKGERTRIMPSPYMGELRRWMAVQKAAASELGFTPTSRPRLAAAHGLPLDTPDRDSKPERRGGLEAFIASNPDKDQSIH